MVFNNSPLKLYMMEAPTRMCAQHIDFRYVCKRRTHKQFQSVASLQIDVQSIYGAEMHN